MPRCEEGQKKNSRWCRRHQCAYDNLRNKETKKGKEATVVWVKKMKEQPTFATEELEKYCTSNAAVGKWKHGGKQEQNTSLKEDHGARVNDTIGTQYDPWEKEERLLPKRWMI